MTQLLLTCERPDLQPCIVAVAVANCVSTVSPTSDSNLHKASRTTSNPLSQRCGPAHAAISRYSRSGTLSAHAARAPTGLMLSAACRPQHAREATHDNFELNQIAPKAVLPLRPCA
jgi:hypothetical protein